MANPQRKRLGEILLEAGIIDGTKLQSALGHQRRWGGRLGQALIDLKMASEEQIVSATLATKMGFERAPVESIEYGPGLELALRLVPHEFDERNQLLPYAADVASLWVAMADPTNYLDGDPIKYINWKASARTNRLKTKQFASQLAQPVMLDFARIDIKSLEEKLACLTYVINRLYKNNVPFGLRFKHKVFGIDLSYSHKLNLLTELGLYAQD